MANPSLSQRPSNKNPLAFLTHSKKVMRPLVALIVLLVIWQALCSGTNPNLPAPLTVIQETWNPLIINPFFDNISFIILCDIVKLLPPD